MSPICHLWGDKRMCGVLSCHLGSDETRPKCGSVTSEVIENEYLPKMVSLPVGFAELVISAVAGPPPELAHVVWGEVVQS